MVGVPVDCFSGCIDRHEVLSPGGTNGDWPCRNAVFTAIDEDWVPVGDQGAYARVAQRPERPFRKR